MSRIMPIPSGPFATAFAALRRHEEALANGGRSIIPSIADPLRAEATGIAGFEGLAQADALVDIVQDGHLVPESWPIEEMIELLMSGDTSTDRCEALLWDLCSLSWRINALAERREAVLGKASLPRAAQGQAQREHRSLS